MHRLLHLLLHPQIKWAVCGALGGLLGGVIGALAGARAFRIRILGVIFDLLIGVIAAHIGQRVAGHLGFYNEGTNLYILAVAASSGALAALLFRLFVNGVTGPAR